MKDTDKTKQQLILELEESREMVRRGFGCMNALSFEVRQYLVPIAGYAEMTLREPGNVLTDRDRKHLKRIVLYSERLARFSLVIDMCKIISIPIDVNPESFSVQALITSCNATVRHLLEHPDKPHINLEYVVEDGIEEAHTDQACLQQILTCMLINATQSTNSDSVTVNVKQENDQLVISVSDTGKRFPEIGNNSIFDITFRKQLVELLGGSIHAQDEEGKGSIVVVRIPMVYTK